MSQREVFYQLVQQLPSEYQQRFTQLLQKLQFADDQPRSPSTTGTSLGSVVRKIPKYNANGEVEGYIPIYDSIT